ncbi:MAG: 2OG-Fe(II) oxygenase [Bacteroidia bacterium]|nr:2OG-Fe(II) oxygenase [Bacteroidia bacterium]NNC85944.1 2OG-Fe(II) oxygenase [Bacteroidia bacterium]NNM16555.1 2OG-Fe(II) oxygenase [Bacteroidia bacterium]
MINFDLLEKNKEELRLRYLTASPYPHIAIENFCDRERLLKAYDSIPLLENKSRDYMFAGNKFEKSNYGTLGPELLELQEELRSDRMNKLLTFITCENTFVDPKNYGGGLHQGRENTFLDMHLDFNYHPMHKLWWRSLNLLLYMNKDWKEEYGGHLELEDLRTGERKSCKVDFNTLIIQKCSDYTLHGYYPTKFPEGVWRTSIATYAFTKHIKQIAKPRTTDWFPDKEGDGSLKKWFGRNFHHAVKVKTKIFGSATAKNQ